MHPWIETVCALVLSALCFVSSYHFRRGRFVWMSLGILGVVAGLVGGDYLSRRESGFLLSASVPAITAPIFCFPLTRITRYGLALITVLVAGYSGWMEFIGPALSRSELAALRTNITNEGICIQGTEYTCGPAAAVTLLRKLGFPAEEGEVSLLAYASNHTGTNAHDLKAAMVKSFGQAGLHCHYEITPNIMDLRKAGLALTTIELEPGLGHWLAILSVTDTEVQYGDPLSGYRTDSIEAFERRWQHQTIRVWREDVSAR